MSERDDTSLAVETLLKLRAASKVAETGYNLPRFDCWLLQREVDAIDTVLSALAARDEENTRLRASALPDVVPEDVDALRAERDALKAELEHERKDCSRRHRNAELLTERDALKLILEDERSRGRLMEEAILGLRAGHHADEATWEEAVRQSLIAEAKAEDEQVAEALRQVRQEKP